jgi:magnesium transporter
MFRDSAALAAFAADLRALQANPADSRHCCGSMAWGRHATEAGTCVCSKSAIGSRALRESLTEVGAAGDHLSRIRETVLGLQRVIAYVAKAAADWLGPELKARLGTAQQDLSSLVDFEAHLSGKTQFLLDAILGFINTEQNEIFKVLTIVSVVGIPPTLIASMYGMNFHDMPELSWRWGYPYGLALIALSIVLPVLWFKRRGWW